MAFLVCTPTLLPEEITSVWKNLGTTLSGGRGDDLGTFAMICISLHDRAWYSNGKRGSYPGLPEKPESLTNTIQCSSSQIQGEVQRDKKEIKLSRIPESSIPLPWKWTLAQSTLVLTWDLRQVPSCFQLANRGQWRTHFNLSVSTESQTLKKSKRS